MGKFERLIVGLMRPLAYCDAKEIKDALSVRSVSLCVGGVGMVKGKILALQQVFSEPSPTHGCALLQEAACLNPIPEGNHILLQVDRCGTHVSVERGRWPRPHTSSF